MDNYSKKIKLSQWGFIIIGCGLFITICILSYQYYYWISKGEWLSLPLYKPLQYIGISFVGILDLEWKGLQNIIFWILERPLAGVISISSLAIGWILTIKN